jgi:hypothetical protein
MPDFSCALEDIQTDVLCADTGGLLTVFWADKSKIDWTAMAEIANWDDANYTVLNWIMTGGGTWGEITFQRKNGRLDSLYTSDNGYYEVNLLNMILTGHTATRTVNLGSAISCCGIVAQVFDNNSSSRVIGKEFIDGAWVDPLDVCRISRHLDTTGGFGSLDDKSRDEFDLAAQHLKPPAYSSVTLTTMRTL